MDEFVLTALRIGLLVLLWFFIWMTLRALRRGNQVASGAPTARRAGAAPARRAATRGSAGPANRIEIVEGPLQGSHMDISGVREIVMGRSSDCDFVLGDDYCSARHARLFRRGSDWFIEDLDSRNGTAVSGTRIDQPERVGTGSDIRVGRTTVRLAP